MSTAVTVHKPTVTPAPVIEWESEAKGATMLFRSGLCPTGIKTPEAALFVILAGRDLGLSPVASLRNISVIQGKIEVAADMQLALFHREGGRSRWLELTDQRAALELSAPWTMESHISEFTAKDATRAGLSGDNWRKYPKAMLRSRAITQGLKDIGYDSTAGVYAPGEIGGPEAGPAGDQPVKDVEEVSAVVVIEKAVDIVREMTLAEANDFEMPVGNSKGKKLRSITTPTLDKAYEYFVNRPEFSHITHAIAMVKQGRLDGEAAPPPSKKEQGKAVGKAVAESLEDFPEALKDDDDTFLDRLDAEGRD